MKINKTIIVVILLFGLLVGGLVAGAFLNRQPTAVEAAPAVQQSPCVDDDDDAGEAEDADEDENEAEDCDKNEADEANEADDDDDGHEGDEADDPGALQGQTSITEDEAKAAAEAANPGTKTLAVELDQVNENGGAVIYEVELDNGLDVQVDATNGKILKTEQRDAD